MLCRILFGRTDVEVNYMDDVGQTLLNWASAFGTPEMVEFLCERGADVNRGLRSSSLHYAACFGRPQIVKVGHFCSQLVALRHCAPTLLALKLISIEQGLTQSVC